VRKSATEGRGLRARISDSSSVRNGEVVQRSHPIGPVPKNFAANLLPRPLPPSDGLSGGIEQLLTVREIADHLGVRAATVYKWAAGGVLPHVRIVNVIRIRPQDLTRLLAVPPLPPALPQRSR